MKRRKRRAPGACQPARSATSHKYSGPELRRAWKGRQALADALNDGGGRIRERAAIKADAQ